MNDYPTDWSFEKPALVLLVVTYLIVGTLYALYTPDWQVPDEPAHYNYVAQLDADGCCPLMEAGDYDQAYLSALTGARFDPAITGQLSTVQYEDHQPPLYYLLQWPVFALSGGSLAVMRLFSVVLGAGVVLLAWAAVRILFPLRPWMALAAAAFVAFVPQHVAFMAGVNNDGLAELCIGGATLASLLYLRGDEMLGWRGRRPHPALLGLLVGLSGLSKTTAYFTLGVALLAVFWRWRFVDRARVWRRLCLAVLWVVVVAALVNAPWWLRNVGVYGFPDVTGLARHDTVVINQPRTEDWIADHGFDGWLDRFTRFTFNSFWGQFGWMAVPMPGWVYALLKLFVGFVLTGVVLGIARNLYKKEDKLTPAQLGGVALLALALLLTTAQYVLYNLVYVQHQGRYLFPALTALAFGVAVGLDGWIRPLVGPMLGRYRLPLWSRWVPAVGLWLALATLDLYALWRFIVPALAL